MTELGDLTATLKGIDGRLKTIEERDSTCHGPKCPHVVADEKQTETLKKALEPLVEKCVGDHCKKMKDDIKKEVGDGITAIRATNIASSPNLSFAAAQKKAAEKKGDEAQFFECPHGCGGATVARQPFCHQCGKEISWSKVEA